mmetsp:Transcript_408/g.657  ORF Transcript_408/g.657 Transcript_408/m.657 type:complete len:540 (-) Transcript_408:110-1729(-)
MNEGKRKKAATAVVYGFVFIITGTVFILSYLFGRSSAAQKQLPCPPRKNVPVKVNAAEIPTDCGNEDLNSKMCMHSSHRAQDRNISVLYLARSTVPEDVFPHLHHPTSPTKWSFYLIPQRLEKIWSTEKGSKKGHKGKENILQSPCGSVYLTRTGSFKNQPNKCIAVTLIPEGHASIVQQSHRYGTTALKTDQYQEDYPRDYAKGKESNENKLLYPFLQDLNVLVQEFLTKMGSPITIDGAGNASERKMAIVMVANEGVMDLLLNFLCSAEEIHLDLQSVVVFVGDLQYVQLIESMGANAMYSPSLGSMPANAAETYLDDTFSRMMWFKVTSVYLALLAGYNVLFQDVDLVWLRDPFKYLLDLNQDVIFMDDGQKSPRYTPFYVNSGFYFVRHNLRTLYLFEKMMKCGASEIERSHSHQQVLIRHIAESHHLYGLGVHLLDSDLFPSGQTYHENKPLVKKIQAKTYRPYVFHMCWTDNRENKVLYFKDVGLWYLPDNEDVCSKGSAMLSYHNQNKGDESAGKSVVRDKCCMRDRYWPTE